MSVVPEKNVFVGKKLAVQTPIDLQVAEMERLEDEDIEAYDRWVIIRTVQAWSFFKENKGSFVKALRLEAQVFAAAKTESVIEAMNRRNYIILKIKVRKLSEILDILRSNYDYQVPTVLHDQAVVTQLFII